MADSNQNVIPPQLFQDDVRFRPLGDCVVVQPEDQERKTASGLILPGQDRTRPLVGKVLAVGPGRLSKTGALVTVPVKPGDRVLYHRYEGEQVKSGEKPAILILEAEDLLAVVEPAKKTEKLPKVCGQCDMCVDMLRVGQCEKIYDAPCWCNEQKGSKPGHIHSSRPATHKEKK